MNRRRLYLGCLLGWLACGLTGYAQDEGEEPLGALRVAPAEDTHAYDQAIPVRYDADRFIVLPISANMDEMTFLTSTGDNDFIYSDKVVELSVPISMQGTKAAIYLPECNPEHSIPVARGSGGLMAIQAKRLRRAYLGDSYWGVLGHDWFSDRIWTLDYPAKKLSLCAPDKIPSVSSEHTVPLGFRLGPRRERRNHLPRITITIGGEPVEMLLNTGATIMLSESAQKALGDDGPATRGVSFITDERLSAWQKKHGWRVIEKAEAGDSGRLIEVPKVGIGGYEVGPVWFAGQPDRVYRDHVSRQLDAPVEGAVGGNLLKWFRVTLDYPSAKAYFEKP